MSSWTKLASVAAAAASGFLISSCGGSAPGPSPTNPNPATPTIASITLSLDRVIVKNAGEPPVKVTANAVNSNGQAVSGVPLTFTVDPGSSISPGSGPTNAQGAATADVTLLDRTNRVVTVRVASGAVISSASFSVTGAQLTYTIGTSQVTAGGTAKVNFLLRDASDSPMPGQKITLSSSLNNFTPISATTNASGQYELTYTATNAGSDVITASAAGASPLSPPTIQVGTGVLPNPSATPRTFTFQVLPPVVDANLSGNANRSALVVRVFGDQGVPVQNAQVTFRIAAGGQFGALGTTQVVLTDGTGTATTDFIPGPASTAQDQVILCATVAGGTATPSNPRAGCLGTESGGALTVRASAVSVVVAPSGMIIVPDNLTYRYQFVVQVASVGGAPVSNALLSVESLDHPRYYWGQLVPGAQSWVFGPGSPVICKNEDGNRNDVLDPGEDVNGTQQLEPRRPVNVYFLNGNNRTDSRGQAIIEITYPKQFGLWLDLDLSVRALVGGSEGRASTKQYPLLVATAELNDVENRPAFADSPFGPFGTTASCTPP